MPDMRFIGAHERAKLARQELVRLRREFDLALPPDNWHDYELPSAMGELAECMAVLRGILSSIDERMPADSPTRARLAAELQRSLEWYREYHKVPR